MAATYTVTGGELICKGTDITTHGICKAVRADFDGSQNLTAVDGNPANAFFNDDVPAIERLISGVVNGSAVTTITITSSATASPIPGRLHITRNDGTVTVHRYTARSGSVYTLRQAEDFSVNTIAANADCLITDSYTVSTIHADIQIGDHSTTTAGEWRVVDEGVTIFSETLRQHEGLIQVGLPAENSQNRSGPSAFAWTSTNVTASGTDIEKWTLEHGAEFTAFQSLITATYMITVTFTSGDIFFEDCAVDAIVGSGSSYQGAWPAPNLPRPTFTIRDCSWSAPTFQIFQDIVYDIDGLTVLGQNGFQPGPFPITITNAILQGLATELIGNQGDIDVTFIDPNFFEPSAFLINSSDNITINFSYNLIVADSAGAPIQDARVWLEDETSVIVFNDVTDSSGIPDVGTFQHSALVGFDVVTWTVTLHADHLQKIRAYSYLAQEGTNTADEPFKSTIRLNDDNAITNSLATTAALTNIAIVGSALEITVTASRTMDDIYHRQHWFSVGEDDADDADFSIPMLPTDTFTHTLATGWKLITDTPFSGGVTLTGDLELSSVIDLTDHNFQENTGSNLIFDAVGTYRLTDCTLDVLVNTSGSPITVELVNSTFITNTGPNITIKFIVATKFIVRDATTNALLQGARIFLTETGGTPTLFNELTDVSGEVNEELEFSVDTSVVIEGLVKFSTTPGSLYKDATITNTLNVASGAFESTILMLSDE